MTDPIFNFQTYNPGINNITNGCFSGHTNKYALYNTQSNKISIFQLNQDKPQYVFDDFTQHVTCSYISKNEQLLVVGLDSGSVRVYDLTSGKVLRAFSAHQTAITAIQITQNNAFMATASIDGKVRFWDLENHQLLQDISPYNAMLQKANKLVTDVSNPEVSCLTFNYQSTWLFIGDQSGRVLIWSLQTMQFIAEFLFGKKIAAMHAHQIQKLLFVSCGNQLNLIDLDDYTLIKTINRQYHAIFTPIKNNMIVGVRSSGLDVFDNNFILSDQFIVQSLEYNFKNTLFCGERKTTTIPQILVVQVDTATGTLTIEVCSLKVMQCFMQFLPNNQTIQPQQIVQQPQQPAAPTFPAMPTPPQVLPKPQEAVQSPLQSVGTKQLDNFLMKHNMRMKHLNDRLILLKQVEGSDPLESAMQISDIGLFMMVYASYPITKIDLNSATRIIKFLDTQIQMVCNLQLEQLQFCIQTVSKLAQQYVQLVTDTEFVFRNNGPRNRDFQIEDRYTRTQDFKQSVTAFQQSLKFVGTSTKDNQIKIKLQTGISELERLGWR